VRRLASENDTLYSALIAAGDLNAVRPPNINCVYVDRRECDAAVDGWKSV
jgi:hypothetical protein